jgi:hypothetical protein
MLFVGFDVVGVPRREIGEEVSGGAEMGVE